MAYRDDLEAAMARIAALEEELAISRAPGDAHARLRDRNQQLEQELARTGTELRDRNLRLEQELARARREIADLTEKLYGRPRDAPTRMIALLERNRQKPARLTGQPMGVVCPACLAIGDRGEMVRPDPDVLSAPRGLIAVLCPSCANLGLLRE